ncbi:hypothetical protein ACHQM5_018278 [Ranunculus cassubicifolius]
MRASLMESTFCTALLFLLFISVNLLPHNLIMSTAQLLPDSEVQILQQISTKLGIKQWDVKPRSCSPGTGLNATIDVNTLSNVTCNCAFDNGTTCHVVTM